MRYLVLLAVLVLLVYFLKRRRRPPSLTGAAVSTVRVADVPRILERIAATGEEGAFAVFIFDAPDRGGVDDRVNVQFSIEEGKPGFDWVLLTATNLRDRDRYARLAASLGHAVREREMNDVPYLRVEDGDLAQLCLRVMQDLYRLGPADPVELLVEGFEPPV